MAYSSPRTWTTGELVTAAELNQEIRDNLNAAFPIGVGAWTAWTPQLDQGATTNIAKTVAYARYMQIGKLFIASFSLTVTGTGTASAAITLTYPATAGSGPAGSDIPIGTGFVFDTSANTYYHGLIKSGVSNIHFLFAPLTSIGVGAQQLGLGSVAGTTLMSAALASGDQIQGTLLYEAA